MSLSVFIEACQIYLNLICNKMAMYNILHVFLGGNVIGAFVNITTNGGTLNTPTIPS